MISLGFSCFYHDSSVAFVSENEILFAMAEERLSRRKHDRSFPQMAFHQGLQRLGITPNDIDCITYYENPDLKLYRLFDYVLDAWPRSWNTFSQILPKYYFNHYPIKRIAAEQFGTTKEYISVARHHLSHAAAAFFTSPFERSLILTVDGVGEQETLCVYLGQGNTMRQVKAVHFPDSLGLLYSVITHYLGFKPNNDEYKVMGLAPYGKGRYTRKILEHLVVMGEDGYPLLNQKFFSFDSEEQHYTKEMERLFGFPARTPDSPTAQEHQDLAASLQQALEHILFSILRPLQEETKEENLCLGGGVALNCAFNGKLLDADLFRNVHIHNACGDDGAALGAAILGLKPETHQKLIRFHKGYTPYLGTAHTTTAITKTLDLLGVSYTRLQDAAHFMAKAISKGKIVALFQGRDEWGPRALGNRSILADPRDPAMKDTLNAKIKFREGFRPFAPVCLEEEASEWFHLPPGVSHLPDMLFTVQSRRPAQLGAVTHVDGTCRLQTVNREQNPLLHATIAAFFQRTGVPVLVNTSFNLRGEPIVANPSDAIRSFSKSMMDYLIFNGEILVSKENIEKIQ